jgi:hypothetical protein
MEITQIVNQVGLISANLILTIAFIYLTIRKYENKDNVKMPIISIVMLLTYVLLVLVSFLIMKEVNVVYIIFYIIIFICLIGMLLLSLDNFNLKKILTDNVTNKIKNTVLKNLDS